jgi:hypothetical protein
MARTYKKPDGDPTPAPSSGAPPRRIVGTTYKKGGTEPYPGAVIGLGRAFPGSDSPYDEVKGSVGTGEFELVVPDGDFDNLPIVIYTGPRLFYLTAHGGTVTDLYGKENGLIALTVDGDGTIRLSIEIQSNPR